MTDTLTVLRKARELLSDEACWCQGALAIDALQHNVSPDDDDACQWCLYGAISRFCGDWDDIAACRVVDAVAEDYAEQRRLSIPFADQFNDDPTTSHADVLAVLDEAIEKART